MKLQKIANMGTGHILFIYSEDECMSVLFNYSSHTENHLKFIDEPFDKWFSQPLTTGTLEIMVRGEKLVPMFEEMGYNNPADYVPVEELLDILKAIDKLE